MLASFPVKMPSGYAGLLALTQIRSPVSREAGTVREMALALANSIERSQALFGRKTAAIARLLELKTECGEDGWDGNGAAPISPLAVLRARLFLRVLPDRLPMPEFAAEPDGSISLDWIRSRDRLFSVSISGSNRLAYAWLDGTDSGHGVDGFDGQTIPQRIREGIEHIEDIEDASLGIT